MIFPHLGISFSLYLTLDHIVVKISKGNRLSYLMVFSQLLRERMRRNLQICFINFRVKNVLVRKHARSEAPLGERCAMICNRYSMSVYMYIYMSLICNDM